MILHVFDEEVQYHCGKCAYGDMHKYKDHVEKISTLESVLLGRTSEMDLRAERTLSEHDLKACRGRFLTS